MIAPIAAQAQWSSCTNGICYSGNVGIGTTSPNAPLVVEGSDYWGVIRVLGSGSTGQADITFAASSLPFGTVGYWQVGTNIGSAPANTLTFYGAGVGNAMTINNSGNVGIGTTNPQYPLQVNGPIAASEVTVTTSLSDYVFDPKYRLRPLQEIADYVKQNHHLPDIPSDAEAKQKGVSLGEMQAKLLAKIEELTLHMIQAEQENRELRERIANLERAASAR